MRLIFNVFWWIMVFVGFVGAGSYNIKSYEFGPNNIENWQKASEFAASTPNAGEPFFDSDYNIIVHVTDPDAKMSPFLGLAVVIMWIQLIKTIGGLLAAPATQGESLIIIFIW
jgi:hypothetical protein